MVFILIIWLCQTYIYKKKDKIMYMSNSNTIITSICGKIRDVMMVADTETGVASYAIVLTDNKQVTIDLWLMSLITYEGYIFDSHDFIGFCEQSNKDFFISGLVVKEPTDNIFSIYDMKLFISERKYDITTFQEMMA